MPKRSDLDPTRNHFYIFLSGIGFFRDLDSSTELPTTNALKETTMTHKITKPQKMHKMLQLVVAILVIALGVVGF